MNRFGRLKTELARICLVENIPVQQIFKYRIIDVENPPVLVISIMGNGYRESDLGDTIDVAFASFARFTTNAEAEAAEDVLDEIEERLNRLFRGDDAPYQVNEPYWGAVDFYRVSERPPSPLGPGYRYGIKYMRFLVYDNP